MKKVEDKILIESYVRTGSIWKTAKEVGLCGQSVHERLVKLVVIRKMNLWTQDDDNILLAEYATYKKNNTLGVLAEQMGRTKQFICRKARKLGLTSLSNRNTSDSVRKRISESTKAWIKEKGHPRGYLGHKHCDETLKKLSAASHAAWMNPSSKFNTEEFRQQLSDRLHKRKMSGEIRVYSNRGDHAVVIGDRNFVFKSSWEVEIAKRLHALFLDGIITNWSYESKHFNFGDMKRTTRSYCPDFEVVKKNGDILYIEVKGWKMKNSMKRIEMFLERYPHIDLYIIDEKEYGKILSESDYLRRRCV